MFANLTPNAAELCFSSARLGSYQRFFHAKTDRETLGAHMWHQTVSASLWPLIGMVEVVFRNRAHRALSQLHGGVPSRAWYGAGPQDMRLKGLQSKVDDILNQTDDAGNHVVNTIDEFIAETTFGLWVHVLQQLDANRRYRFCSIAFPNYPPVKGKTAWIAPLNTWMPLIKRMEGHRAFRNRIAHHAPLWTIPYLTAPGAASILPSGPGALIQSLRQQASTLRTTIEDMEPNLADFWDGEPKQAFMNLTTVAMIEKAMGKAAPPEAAPATAPGDPS